MSDLARELRRLREEKGSPKGYKGGQQTPMRGALESLARKAARGELTRGPRHRYINQAIAKLHTLTMGEDSEAVATDAREHLGAKEVAQDRRDIERVIEWLEAYASALRNDGAVVGDSDA